MPVIKRPYKQHWPFSVQIELVEGCTLACSFCGINGIREKAGNFKYASMETMEKVASELKRLNWPPRIEFAMHGEPSQHPRAVEAISIFRKHLPSLSLMMTSNGSGFTGTKVSRIKELADAGLNVLGLDDYKGVKFVTNVVAGLKSNYPEIVVRNYPEDRTASIHTKRKPGTFEVVRVEDISVTTKGNHSLLSNHAGQAFPPENSKQHSRCAMPFRELSVRWDGNVALCCDDFRGGYKIGNVNDMPLDVLWEHPRFTAARRKLYHRQRDFGPCNGCTAVTYRVGLLPDPTGKETLPEPTEGDLKHILEATSNGYYTDPILRPWEKNDE